MDLERAEVARKQLFLYGRLLVTLGLWSLFGAWGWIAAILSLAAGSLLIANFKSKEAMGGRVSGVTSCCGGVQGLKREDDCAACAPSLEARCCCAPWHLKGMLIALLVFSVVDILWSIPVAVGPEGRSENFGRGITRYYSITYWPRRAPRLYATPPPPSPSQLTTSGAYYRGQVGVGVGVGGWKLR